MQYQTAKPQVISLCRARDRQCESKFCFPLHIKSCQSRKYGASRVPDFSEAESFAISLSSTNYRENQGTIVVVNVFCNTTA